MAVKSLNTSSDTPFHDPTLYRSIVGGLLYLAMTRPDLSYSVNVVCQHIQAPTNGNFQAVKRILHYLNETKDLGLRLLSTSSLQWYAFSDSDWARCPITRRSTIGFCTFLGSNLIS